MPTHGDYNPSKGWYSAVTKAWHSKPDAIGTVVPAEDVESLRHEFDRMNDRAFRANPDMEALIKLRESSKAEDRTKFDQLARGGLRMSLAGYEQAKAQAEGQE